MAYRDQESRQVVDTPVNVLSIAQAARAMEVGGRLGGQGCRASSTKGAPCGTQSHLERRISDSWTVHGPT